MASASAAERSQSDPALRDRRGQQVVLTFSQQGTGNFVNGCVILILMAIWGQTGKALEARASRAIISVQFAVAAAVSVFMTLWRYLRLKESAVWKAEREDAVDITEHIEHRQVRGRGGGWRFGGLPGGKGSIGEGAASEGWEQATPQHTSHKHKQRAQTTHGQTQHNLSHTTTHTQPNQTQPLTHNQNTSTHKQNHNSTTQQTTKQTTYIYKTAFARFWPRLFVTSMAWVANDFAFYGNKLFQSTFIAALYPDATPFERMQWTVLNSAVSLAGYWLAAAWVDKKWYGRRLMQSLGFWMMFILFLICGAAFGPLTASKAGYRAFQALYFLSSFFNQFGPNCTTWLVAAEVFPTDVRATFQGISAAWGKVGAIIADVAFGYVSMQTSFYLSAAFGVVGAIITMVFLPDTTGLPLDELDRLVRC